MNRDFDVFVKEHLQDILCQVEKDQALAKIKPARVTHHAALQHKHSHHPQVAHPELQDCAISPSFSHNKL